MTEIALHQGSNDLAVQMDYAKAVASATMLPSNYRGKPADIMLAVGLGQSMGLSPAESLYRISVIQGRPAANAELIAANVRKAGHKLRVRVTENPPSATCTIIRADDPDEPFVITRDMEWAKGMDLIGKDNYKKQPSTMLSWRAIAACARLACPEALYGVAHTPDEIDVAWDGTTAPPRSGGSLSAALNDQPAVTAEQVDETGEALTDHTRREMFALFTQKGVKEEDQLSGINHLCGTAYESRGDLTEADGRKVVEFLRTRPDAEDQS